MEHSDLPATRIVLVDDHAVVRAGLRQLLVAEPGFEVVAEAGTGREAVELVEVKRPDVVVLDIGLPDADGLELIELLRAKGRGSRILLLSMHDEPSRVERAFQHGADGYLVKDAAEGELVAAIESLRRGERYLYPPLGAALVAAAGAPASDPLSDREREIVRLLAFGHTNSEIAASVHLSVRTVETHRAHAMSKLRLSSRSELVRWALDRGLLEDPP
jgi:DNA-binding NarL/FixJ family response regulator